MPKDLEPISESLFPKSAAAYWSIFAQLQVAACLVSLPVALTVAWPFFWDAVLYTFIGGLALSPICLIFAGTQTDYLHRKLGTVHFDGETVSVYDKEYGSPYSAKLADCRWFVGNRAWATVPLRGNLICTGFGKALLIVFPESIKTPEYRVRKMVYAVGPAIVAVGLTPETRRQWEYVINWLGPERDLRRESLASPVSVEFTVLWTFMMLPVSWFIGLWSSRAMDNLLTQWNVPADIALGISFPLFVPGTIWIGILLIAFPVIRRTEQGVHQSRRGRAAQWEAVIRMAWVTGLLYFSPSIN